MSLRKFKFDWKGWLDPCDRIFLAVMLSFLITASAFYLIGMVLYGS